MTTGDEEIFEPDTTVLAYDEVNMCLCMFAVGVSGYRQEVAGHSVRDVGSPCEH